MKPHSRRTHLLVPLAFALILAACGDGTTDQSTRAPGAGSTSPPTTAVANDPSTTATTAPGSDTTATPGSTTTTLAPLPELTFEALEGIDTIQDFSGLTDTGMNRWQESVDGIQDIRIASTADGVEQPAFWLPPSGDGEQPLLVILHSWSTDYLQHAGIPYAMWAQENGWAVIAPQFRGVNDHAEAIGSDLAVQDVADAIDFAVAQDGVSDQRVYAVGYSGGGMMALLLAGRHPDKVTAVASWGPPYDLVAFYRQSRGRGSHYAPDIEAGCGGDPSDEGPVRDECLHRSPMSHLDAAKENGVAVFIGQGVHDSILTIGHGAGAFNQLADDDGKFSEEQLEEIWSGSLPDDLSGAIDTETFFGDGDPDPVFARQSAGAWLVYFDADHDMVYKATARWLATDPGQ